ncbi:MAG TPA: hypothetical protein VFO98_06210 [Marmoricola sp.]|nr:hypothetical protein [Marmoricola sp.]
MSDDIHDGVGHYDVVLLVEQALSGGDARQVHGLHDSIEDPVVYHVLIPVEDSANRIEAGLGGLGSGEMLVVPSAAISDADLADIREELLEECRADLASTIEALRVSGARAVGETVAIDPIEALAAKVAEVDAREAIVLTRPHVVQEFFHLDWTSRARRKLGVPVLHLLEHENFDEQAGEGEGITGV